MPRLHKPTKSNAPRVVRNPLPSRETVLKRMEPKGETIDPTPEILAMRRAAFEDPKSARELCCPFDCLSKQLGRELVIAGQRAKVAYAWFARNKMPSQIWPAKWWADIDASELGGSVANYQVMCDAILRNVRRRFIRSPNPDKIARDALMEVRRAIYGQWPKNVELLRIGLEATVRHFRLSHSGLILVYKEAA